MSHKGCFHSHQFHLSNCWLPVRQHGKVLEQRQCVVLGKWRRQNGGGWYLLHQVSICYAPGSTVSASLSLTISLQLHSSNCHALVTHQHRRHREKTTGEDLNRADYCMALAQPSPPLLMSSFSSADKPKPQSEKKGLQWRGRLSMSLHHPLMPLKDGKANECSCRALLCVF